MGISREKFGGAERDRTADLLVANEALSQLSYSPPPDAHELEAVQALLMERPTPLAMRSKRPLRV